MLRILSLACVVLACGSLVAQPKPDPKLAAKIAMLEKQIADEEKKLAAMKAELAKLKPMPQLKELPWAQLSVGDVGSFTYTFGLVPQVYKVIDEETMLVKMTGHPEKVVVMVKAPTKGLAESRFFGNDDFKGAWKVSKTEKHSGTTYYVLEPAK